MSRTALLCVAASASRSGEICTAAPGSWTTARLTASCEPSPAERRGRCILFMPFADAPKLREIASEPAEAPALSKIVQLDVAGAKRELVAMEARTRELVRRTAMLVDRNRYEAKHLYYAGSRRSAFAGWRARGALATADSVARMVLARRGCMTMPNGSK